MITKVTKLWCFHPPGCTTNSLLQGPPGRSCFAGVTTSWRCGARAPAASLRAVTTGREWGCAAKSPPAPQDGARREWRARVIKPLRGKAALLGPFSPSTGQVARTGSDRSSPTPFLRAIKHAKFALLTWLTSSTRASAGVPAKPKPCKSALPRQQSNFSSLMCFITQQKETHIFGN